MRESDGLYSVLCWIPFGAVAAAQSLMIGLGSYNPVTDDFVPASFMPVYYGHLAAQLTISMVTSLYILGRRRSKETRSALKVVVVAWIAQVLVWVAFVVARVFWI